MELRTCTTIQDASQHRPGSADLSHTRSQSVDTIANSHKINKLVHEACWGYPSN